MTPLLTPAELQTVLSRGEGQFVEFKSAWDCGSTPRRPLGRRALRDKIADVVAAFANAGGGLLLVGVNDDGTATGHGYDRPRTAGGHQPAEAGVSARRIRAALPVGCHG